MNNEQEIWRQIPMYPTYAASNLGRIKNIKRDTIMAQSPVDDRDYQKVCISYKNKPYTKKVSRLVWAAFNDCDCPDTIDHIDGNALNNSAGNLRLASASQNQFNRKKQKNNATGYKNISFIKKSNRYHCAIRVNGKDIFVGLFDTIKEAVIKRDLKTKELMGEYSRS
jgi:hypothetical protein